MNKKRTWTKPGRKKRARIIAGMLCFCLLFTTYPELTGTLSVQAAPQGEEDNDILYLSRFAGLPEEVREQSVPAGWGGAEQLLLPDTLEAVPAGVISTDSGQEPGQEAYEDGETAVIEGVTWQSQPTYDGNTEGTYLFTAQLPEGYGLTEGAVLPQITVKVQESGRETLPENSGETVPETLTRKIAALPDPEEYLAGEPDAEEEEAYAEWMRGLYAYAEETLAIGEAYEALTEEQQAQIPEKELEKLKAWEEIAKQASESSQVMAVAESGTISGTGLSWSLSDAGVLTISGSGAMPDWDGLTNDPPWYQSKSSIKSVIVGEGVTSIGDYAFYYFENATNVTINGKVTKIGKAAFQSWKKLESMDIPDSVTSIGQRAFSQCDKLESVNIPDGVTSIGGHAFSNCISLKSVTIPGSVKTIMPSTFLCCDSLESVTIQEGVEVIEYEAFKSCDNLTEINIPDSVTYITHGAFMDCVSLTEIEIPANVTNIEHDVFKGCKKLERVVFHGTTTIPKLYSISDRVFQGCPFYGTTKKALIIPACGSGGIYEKYVATQGWNYFVDNIDTVSSHTLEMIEAKDASCEEAGNSAYYRCTACGELFAEDADGNKTETTAEAVTIAPKGHSYTYKGKEGDPAVVMEECSNGCGHSAYATLSLKDGADLTYTGSSITPAVITYDTGWKGAKPAISKITYSNNTKAGQASASITIGGQTASIQFSIAPRALTDSMITLTDPHYYTGNALEPAVTVVYGGRKLTKGTDYTVTYTNNTNVGKASAQVEGKGNYTGTISREFTIEYASLPTGKKLTDYLTITPALSQDQEGWYGSDISLAPKSGCGIGEAPDSIGSDTIVISDETEAAGETKTIYIRDNTGKIYQTEFPYKLDKTQPQADLTGMTVENGAKGLWDWIIGKKNMSIKIPASGITDELSGTAEVTYTAEPDSGAGRTAEAVLKDGSYEIALNAEFSGTIKLSIKDKAGNTAQISLTAENGKVIAEDYAPECTLSLPEDVQPGDNGWYTQDVTITVTVTDNRDGETQADRISGGIASVTWKDGEDGEEQTKSLQDGEQPVYKDTFTISVNTSGSHIYYVKAMDNAGNESGWKSIAVKLDTELPAFEGEVTAVPSLDGAEITFTPSEGGKVYWIAAEDTDPAGTKPDAQKVAEEGEQNGYVKEITGGEEASFTITGLASGVEVTVYAVIEDEAGNLSQVKEISFVTAVPDITLPEVKQAVENALEELTADNDTTKESIQEAVDKALEEAGITDETVTVTVGDINKTEATKETEGSITGTITIICGEDRGEVEINKTIAQLPKTDADKVEEARKAVEKVLEDLTAANDTTKESIQSAIDKALKDAGITDVTVTVGELTKKDATKEEAGSITGEITIVSGKDGSVSDKVTIEKPIAQLPATPAESVEAAKKIAEAVVNGMKAANDTSAAAIKEAVDKALKEAGITDVTVTVGDLTKKEATKETEGSISGAVTIKSTKDENLSDSVTIDKVIEKLPKTDEEIKQEETKKVEEAKKIAEEVLENLPITNGTTKESIQEAVDKALEEAGITDVTVTVGDIDKTEATKDKEGSITGEITIVSKKDGDVSGKVTIDEPIDKLPVSDEEKVAAAKKIAEAVVNGVKVTNDTTKDDIQSAVDKALKEAGITDVTVTVGDLTKKEATKETEGSISGAVTIKSTKDESLSDSVPIEKVIEKLPKTDEEIKQEETKKVEDAKKIAEEVLKDLPITNGTTKESIQEAVDKALEEAGITDVTVTVGDIDKTEATEDKEGSITGEITIVSKKDGDVSDKVTINEPIDKLPVTPAESVEAAKKIAETVINGVKAANDTTKESIQSAIDKALEEAGITDVTVTVDNFDKTDATKETEGSISGAVTIKSTKDENLSDSVTIDKVIEKLPKTDEEIKQEETKKVEEAKKIAEEVLKNLPITNGTTKESIQEAVDKALEDAGITDVTVTVGDIDKTEATEDKEGSITGEITIVSKKDGDVSDKVTINEPIDKLPATPAESVEAAKKIAETVINGVKVTNDTTRESIQEAVDKALEEAGITDVTVTVVDITKKEATKDTEGSISGTVTIRSTKDESLSDSVTIDKVIEKLPKTDEEIKQEETKKVEDAKKIAEEVLKDLPITNGTTKESIQEAVDKALEEAGITDVTVTVDLTKKDATEEEAGSITGEITIVSKKAEDVSDKITIDESIDKLPATPAESVEAAKKIAETVINGVKVTNDTTKESIQSAIDKALEEAGITDVTVTVGDLTKKEATKETEGSISGAVTIKSTKDENLSDSVPIRKVIEKLPKTDEEIKQEETKKVEDARKIAEEVLKDLPITNGTTKESIQEAVDNALKDAGITDVTVTVDLTKKDATEEEAGSITGEITIVSKKDGDVSDKVTIDESIDKLPVTDEEKVAAAKKIAETVINGVKVTNDTTKDDIQSAVDKALKEAGITDVTVTVGDLTKKEATKETEGSISGAVTIKSTKDESLSDSVPIRKVIEKLPKTDEEIKQEETKKVEDARKIAEEVLKDLPITNGTTKESIQEAVDKALEEAGITDVTVTVGDFTKKEATKDTEGSISGTVTIRSAKDENLSDSVTIDKVIDKLPKTDEEIKQEETKKVEEAKKKVEEALKDLTLDNDTTEEGLQNVIQDAIDRTGMKDVTVTVEDFQKTEATTEKDGSITGNVIIQSGTVKENVTINKIIPKLPGKVDKEVNMDGKTPSMQIVTSEDQLKDMLLEEAEKQLLAEGTDIKIILDVKDASGSAGSADKALVEEALNNSAAGKGFVAGQYLDISLYKVIGEDMRQPISKTRGKITITIDVPDSLKNTDSSITRIYAVVRVHDGKTEILNDLDENVDTITIETDCFSTYAIVYKDSGDGVNNGNDGNDDREDDAGNGNDTGASHDGGQVKSPKTGGSNTVSGWLLLAAVSALGALTAEEKLRRSKKQ